MAKNQRHGHARTRETTSRPVIKNKEGFPARGVGQTFMSIKKNKVNRLKFRHSKLRRSGIHQFRED